MHATLEHGRIMTSLPRWNVVAEELDKLDPDAAKRFRSGSYKEAFDFGPAGSAGKFHTPALNGVQSVHSSGKPSPTALAAAYIENYEALEVAASAIIHDAGWIRYLGLRKDFAAKLVELTGQSAAKNIMGIVPEFEDYLASQVGASAIPCNPRLVSTPAELSVVRSMGNFHKYPEVISMVLNATTLDEYGRKATEKILEIEGIAVGAEVDDYLAAIAEWLGVEKDYVTAVELASYNVLEDDIREYAAAGLTREYAAVLYTADPFEFED